MRRRNLLTGALGLGAVGGMLAAVGQVNLVPRALAELPIEGRIAYVVDGDVWVWSNSQSRQLTRNLKFEGPGWSPDGSLLAASLMGTNHSEIVLLDSNGAQIRQLTKHFSSESVAQQSWGRKPVWSPSGSRIAYISDDGPVTNNGYKEIDMSLFLVDPDGKNLRREVTASFFTGGFDWPSWSPDGKQIAMAVFRTSRTSQIHTYDFESDRRIPLTDYPDGAYSPAWSPDGRWIACTVREGSRNDVYALPLDGGQPVKLTESGVCLAPAWSPDGSQLAYIFQSGDATFDITVLKLDLAGGLAIEDSQQITQGQRVKTTSGLAWTR